MALEYGHETWPYLDGKFRKQRGHIKLIEKECSRGLFRWEMHSLKVASGDDRESERGL